MFAYHYPQEFLEVCTPGTLATPPADNTNTTNTFVDAAPPLLQIRDATEDDIPATSTLLQSYAGEIDMSPHLTSVLKDSSKGLVQVADYGEHALVACAFVSYEYNLLAGAPIWNIQMLYVREEFRRNGIGRRLVQVLCEKGRRSGAAAVVVRGSSPSSPLEILTPFMESVGNRGWHIFLKTEVSMFKLE